MGGQILKNPVSLRSLLKSEESEMEKFFLLS